MKSCDELGVCQSVTKPCPPHTICARKSGYLQTHCAAADCAHNPDERQVWCHIRDHGGWWRASELTRIYKSFDLPQMHQLLKNLLSSKCLQQRNAHNTPGHTGNAMYAYTAQCVPLPGMQRDPQPIASKA
jgi:hypothetical protein